MGRVNPTPGRGMCARLVLFKVDAEDREAIAAGAYDGEVERHGAFTTFRRSDDRVFVVQRIAASGSGGSRRVLAVVYTPGSTRDAQAPFTALVADLGVDVVKSWAVVENADGTLRVPALVADGTAVGTAVKAAWPADWRVRLPGDSPGDPLAVPPVPAAPPSGPLCLGAVIA